MYMDAQHVWLLKILNYKSTVEYKKGKENIVVENLAGKDGAEDNTLMVITTIESDWSDQVKEIVEKDDTLKSLML